ncbi:Putative GTP cyclohydrolase 1 type 2 [Candidatus Izimaplasma bacterium HR1]|jgi:dinuclear metal center YbgI/SA1388 family protein|uniref:Nif3-like dinuclear metal center hexameric protein n=1 Tax=Candidatus Izimoplasma sp. HR1 TaxID=1541959 RepID=UPI0004F683EB|nr:Putative GTP cyclohydrolase 1 type 2 [Candidatus Izimaplasma bacterium HR1]
MIVSEFIKKFEQYFPSNLAYKWDNVGLQVGSDEENITNILLSLDLTNEIIDEAIEKNANFVVVHHPIIFTPLKQINTNTYLGNLLSKIIKNNINIYVAHTNFDLSNFGMNKVLADMLEIEDQKIIELETLDEGLGRYGNLNESMSLGKFIEKVKNVYNLDTVKLISNQKMNYMIGTVAICGGSGSSLLGNDILKYCDIYITGDVTYHHALDAINRGLTVLDVGHHVERHGILSIKSQLETFSQDYRVFLSNLDVNPYKIV